MEWVSFDTPNGGTEPRGTWSEMLYGLLPSWEDNKGVDSSHSSASDGNEEDEADVDSRRGDADFDFFPSSSPTSSRVSLLVGHWLDVHKFFLDAQLSEKKESELSAELPQLQRKLRRIVRCLLAERRDILVKLERPALTRPRTNSTAGAAPGGLEGLRRPSPARGGQMTFSEDVSLILPPCYHYLFNTDPSPLTPSPSTSSAEKKKGASTPPPTKEETVPGVPQQEDERLDGGIDEGVYPPSVGDTFLVLLCQYAKQNFPSGARQIILEFLAQLLYDVDFPPSRLPGGGASTLSLLQLSPSHFIVPLLDMIRQISAILDPGNRKPGTVIDASSGSTINDGERAAFVLLLCVLAEKMERIPDLANFFITSSPQEGGGSTSHFVLLHSLLPYLAHDSGSPEWADRRDTCRFALSAVLSLAKCPDPWVRDVVAAEKNVVSNPLNAACTTLFTLCKVPDNEDSRTELLFLTDVLHFWSNLLLTAPGVAEMLGLQAALEHQFIFLTVLPLLKSPDSRVYSSACLILASLLRNIGSPCSKVMNLVAQAIFKTSVVKGKLDRNPAAAGGTSFLEYYVLPHLSASPSLSPEDTANMAALQYEITRWTGCEATLLLLDAVATCCPHIFLQDALRLADAGCNRCPTTAGSSLPSLHVDELFPATLRGNAGRDAVSIGNDVLSRLLYIESNVPIATLQEWFLHSSTTTVPSPTTSSWWVHKAVLESSLTSSLALLVRHYASLPPTVAVLVSSLLMTLFLQPDCRVFFTLMDPDVGPVTKALREMGKQLDKDLEREEAAMSQRPSASPPPPAPAAKVLNTTEKKNKGAAAWLWKTLAGSSETSSADKKKHPAVTPEPPTPWITCSRKTALEHFRELKEPVDLDDEKAGTAGLSSEVYRAFVHHREFLEMAAQLEQFRVEMKAAVGYIEMSHQLAGLQPGVAME